MARPNRTASATPLSIREEQVLSLAANGLVDKQIASGLSLSENTLRTYWRRIRMKLGEGPRSALAALYVKGKAVEDFKDNGVWTLDVARGLLDYHGDRDLLPQGEIPLTEVLGALHPDDRDRMADLLEKMSTRDTPPVTVVARVMTPEGYQPITTRIESVRSRDGEIVQLLGRPVPVLDLTRDDGCAAHFGRYRRSLVTGTVEIDEGFCEIYRLSTDRKDVRAAVLERYCPASRAKMLRMVDGMIASGPGRRRWTACLCFPDGEKLSISGESYLEEIAGNPTAFVGVVAAYY